MYFHGGNFENLNANLKMLLMLCKWTGRRRKWVNVLPEDTLTSKQVEPSEMRNHKKVYQLSLENLDLYVC